MIDSYKSLYEVLDKMSKELSCGTCGVCENDLIYLLPAEVPRYRGLGIELIEIEGVHYIAKSPEDHGFCPLRDQEKRSCKIYDDRPAVCRMFPLEIKAIGEGFSWGLCTYCPRVSSNQDGIRDQLIKYIPEIEVHLNENLVGFLAHADRVCARIEEALGLTMESIVL